jgi:hypothetical protein
MPLATRMQELQAEEQRRENSMASSSVLTSAEKRATYQKLVHPHKTVIVCFQDRRSACAKVTGWDSGIDGRVVEFMVRVAESMVGLAESMVRGGRIHGCRTTNLNNKLCGCGPLQCCRGVRCKGEKRSVPSQMLGCVRIHGWGGGRDGWGWRNPWCRRTQCLHSCPPPI